MRISAKADYAVRAAMGLALVGGPAKAEHIAQRHAIPLKFLEKILFDLRHAGLVATRRGPEGGYWLARDPAEITVADVLRAVDGPLADVHGLAPEDVEYLEHGFEERIFPVLTPLSVDPAHPFPYISDLSLNLAAIVRDPTSGDVRFARVKVPPLLPRLPRWRLQTNHRPI